jgi:thymidylate kinase
MIIALIGNDGSGKTTTSKELSKVFGSIGFEVIYKHEYDYVLLKFLLKLTGRAKVDQSRKEMLEEHKKGMKFLAWPALVWFDTFLQYAYFKVFKNKAIVILDRYPYDHYISFDFLGYLTPLTKWMYLHFPKPDAAILLWVEPEVAYNRKKETHSYAVSFYQGQTQKYLALADRLGLKNVNTNRDITSSISDIFDILHSKQKLRNDIMKRALQNKTYSDVMLNGIGGKFADPIGEEFKKRVNQFKATVRFLQEMLARLEIKEYTIFKDYGRYRWVGNDVDVIIDHTDFQKLGNYLKTSGSRLLDYSAEWKLSKSHSQSVDIKAEGLLNIDVHTAIGWRGIDVISFAQMKNHIIKKQKFGIEYPCVSNEVDALIYACSHVLEKGFLVYLESQLLRENISQIPNLPIRHDFLESYLAYVAHLGGNKNFPIFIPLSIIRSSFATIRKHWDEKTGLRTSVKIIAMQLAWRFRFIMQRRLPFEVAQYDKQ